MVGITIPTMAYPNIPSVGALAQQEVIRISQTDRTCDHHEKRGKKGVSDGYLRSKPWIHDLVVVTNGVEQDQNRPGRDFWTTSDPEIGTKMGIQNDPMDDPMEVTIMATRWHGPDQGMLELPHYGPLVRIKGCNSPTGRDTMLDQDGPSKRVQKG